MHMHPPMMAKLPRITKSGKDWMKAELDTHNITIVPQTKANIFETNDLPALTEPLLLDFMTNES